MNFLVGYFSFKIQNILDVLCKKDQELKDIYIWEPGGNLQRVWNGAINFNLLLPSAKGVKAYLPSKPKGNSQEALFNA